MSRHRNGNILKVSTPALPGYYVFIVTGGIDPILQRPRFTTSSARDQYMRDIYETNVDEESGDLPCFLNVSARGKVTMGYYSREWLTDKDHGTKKAAPSHTNPQPATP